MDAATIGHLSIIGAYASLAIGIFCDRRRVGPKWLPGILIPVYMAFALAMVWHMPAMFNAALS